MKVMDAARAIGIVVTDGDVSGTIDERKVLTALTDLANDDPANADLFHDAAARVVLARSAGAEGPPPAAPGSIRGRHHDPAPVSVRDGRPVPRPGDRRRAAPGQRACAGRLIKLEWC